VTLQVTDVFTDDPKETSSRTPQKAQIKTLQDMSKHHYWREKTKHQPATQPKPTSEPRTTMQNMTLKEYFCAKLLLAHHTPSTREVIPPQIQAPITPS
jgi:hypothetical protein